MKKLAVLIVSIGMLMAFSGCGKSSDVTVEFPFKPSDVEMVLLLQKGQDSTIKKKLELMEKEQISEAYSACKGFALSEKEWDRIPDCDGYSIAFNLKDGSQYDLTYYPIAVKEGRLVSAAGAFDYCTTSDVLGFWESLYGSASTD